MACRCSTTHTVVDRRAVTFVEVVVRGESRRGGTARENGSVGVHVGGDAAGAVRAVEPHFVDATGESVATRGAVTNTNRIAGGRKRVLCRERRAELTIEVELDGGRAT